MTRPAEIDQTRATLAERLAVTLGGPMTPPRHPQTTPLVSCATQTTTTTTPHLGTTGAATLEVAGDFHH